MSSEAYIGGDRERYPLESVPAECYDVLRHPHRLRILATLGTHRQRLSLADLTTAIVDSEGFDVPNGKARHDIRTSLVHNHLPRLAAYGLLEWDTETGVELVDGSPIHPADLTKLLALCEAENGQAVLEAIVHPVRMRVVSLLFGPERTLSIDRLASKLADRDGESSDPEQLKIALYHSHLPMLADAGVLEFDADSGLVTRHEQAMSISQ